MKHQKGKCTYCNLYITSTDKVEVDHIIPKSRGGKDKYNNLQLLHSHCHDIKTNSDGSIFGRPRYWSLPDNFKWDDDILTI